MKKKTSLPPKSEPSARSSKVKPGRQFRRLSQAVDEMKAVRLGERAPSRVWEVVPDGKGGFIQRQLDSKAVNEATAARHSLKLSQDKFAEMLGISAGTLRGWEQGRRQPNRAALVLLRVAKAHPEVVLEAARAVEV